MKYVVSACYDNACFDMMHTLWSKMQYTSLMNISEVYRGVQWWIPYNDIYKIPFYLRHGAEGRNEALVHIHRLAEIEHSRQASIQGEICILRGQSWYDVLKYCNF